MPGGICQRRPASASASPQPAPCANSVQTSSDQRGGGGLAHDCENSASDALHASCVVPAQKRRTCPPPRTPRLPLRPTSPPCDAPMVQRARPGAAGGGSAQRGGDLREPL